MSYIVQQADLDVLTQGKKTIYIKAELLNKSFLTVETVDGEIIQDNYSVDSNTDIRRTYNVTFVVHNSSFQVGRDKRIWLDKYLRLYVGIYYIRERETRWYPVGVFIINSAGYSFNPTTSEITLSCYDRTAELLSERGSQISGLGVLIPSQIKNSDGSLVNNTIREALISIITQLGGISKYRIESMGGITLTDNGYENNNFIPYDLDFNSGGYVWDIVKTLKDLYPGWEVFFDDDMFICQPIPTYESDPIVLDAEIIAPMVYDESINYNFTEIKNVTEVWGKCLDAEHYTDNAYMSIDGIYHLSYETISEIKNGNTFAFKANNNNLTGAFIKIDNFSSFPLLQEGKIPIESNKIKENLSYVIKYIASDSQSYFLFLGQHQICAITKLVSQYPNKEKMEFDLQNEPTTNISYIIQSDNPFCSDFPDVGEIRQVFYEGEFENITSEDLALQRAEYENWKSTDLLNTITLNMVDIPWLDVNQKIEYISNETGKPQIYLIKSKSGSSIGGTMSLICQKFQPLYPWNI